MKKCIVVILSLFILVSCGTNSLDNDKTEIVNEQTEQTNNISNTQDNNSIIGDIQEISENSGETQELKIEYDETKEELIIGTVKIKKGLPDNLKGELTGYKKEEIYQNSNVANYFFFSTLDNKEEVIKKYKNELLGNGWKILEDSQDLTYIKENKRLEIIISEIIPKNLEELNLTGNFVELQLIEEIVEPELPKL